MISRRTFLTSASVGVLGGLAGCSAVRAERTTVTDEYALEMETDVSESAYLSGIELVSVEEVDFVSNSLVVKLRVSFKEDWGTAPDPDSFHLVNMEHSLSRDSFGTVDRDIVDGMAPFVFEENFADDVGTRFSIQARQEKSWDDTVMEEVDFRVVEAE